MAENSLVGTFHLGPERSMAPSTQPPTSTSSAPLSSAPHQPLHTPRPLRAPNSILLHLVQPSVLSRLPQIAPTLLPRAIPSLISRGVWILWNPPKGGGAEQWGRVNGGLSTARPSCPPVYQTHRGSGSHTGTLHCSDTGHHPSHGLATTVHHSLPTGHQVTDTFLPWAGCTLSITYHHHHTHRGIKCHRHTHQELARAHLPRVWSAVLWASLHLSTQGL